FADDHPWMAENGVEVRWIDEALFARESWLATAAERFRHRFTADVVLALDADTLIVRPLDPLIEETHRTGALGGVIAHQPPFASREQWQALYHAVGLVGLTTSCPPTRGGDKFPD